MRNLNKTVKQHLQLLEATLMLQETATRNWDQTNTDNIAGYEEQN